MTPIIRTFLSALFIWVLGVSVWAAESELVDTGKVNAQLVSSHDSVAPGESFYISLRTVLDPHWHTYWRNPGDSGEPVQITWDVPDTLSYGDIAWPLPAPIATGPIINYGFEGVPFFPVKFTLSPDAVAGEQLLILADIYYLVCKDVCIPEEAQLSLQITVGESVVDGRWDDAIKNAIRKAPQPGEIKAGVTKIGADAVYTFQNLPEGVQAEHVHFFPFEQGIIDHSAPQNIQMGTSGLRVAAPATHGWESGVPEKASGVLGYQRDGKPVGEIVSVVSGLALDVGVSTPKPGGDIGLWTAIIGALLGGLILNLMPCVFPVISIKALNVAKTAHTERAKVRREGWIYTAGVVTTFLLLTAILLMIKTGGAEIGWGFQLQSPKVVAALALLLFVIGLNLLGVFEIGSSLQNTGGGLAARDGRAGTFFTGALAVIVATPCTAPFMAGAIGYALAQSAFVTFAVFMALAIGFAAPFLLLAYMPGLLAKLPKPGPWMVRFREVLAFPMFAAAIWLVWVLNKQAGADGLLLILSAMLLFALAIWCFKRSRRMFKVLGILALLGAIILPLRAKPVSELLTHAWSPAKVAELRAAGRPVFVDFTAAWCVTCKVNEKFVLDRKDVKEIFTKTNTAFLIADWTNKNEEIATELARHGRSGVPLYLVYPPGHNPVTPEILPQVLSGTVIREALENAKNP